MTRFALILGVMAFIAAVIPGGMYIGMGLGGFASTCGFLAYRQRSAPSWSRLGGAMALSIGLIALTIATGRFALTWWAVQRLSGMLA